MRITAGLFLLTALTLPAQFDNAVILGTIRDAKGGAVAGAVITARNKQTGISATGKTGEEGNYLFPALRIGSYRITAEQAGFANAVAEEVNLTVNARQRVDLTLQVSSVTETVNVVAVTPLLETDSSSKGQVIQARQIVSFPVLGRTYSSFALLSPGVRESNSSNSGSVAFRREGAYNVNGLRSVFNNFVLDGVDNNFYGTTNQGFSNQAVQPSPDSVAEFRMMVNAYSAEFGRTGGAVMNVASKSGTNEFHGSAWSFLQNNRLNATGFFKPVDGQKPQNNRNQYGFVFGGPIVKNRTFFFADYEGSRWRISPFALSSLPNAQMRQGILPVDIRVPVTYTASTGQTIAAGTVIPAGQPVPMTRLARFTMDTLPQPNRPAPALAVGNLGIANNFGNFDRNALDDDKGAVKLDHQFRSSVQSFFRYAQRRQNIVAPALIPGAAGGNNLGNLDTFNQAGTMGVTWTKSATEVVDFRFSVSRLGMDRTPASVGGPSMREVFGITGLPEGDKVRGGITPQDIVGFPRYGRQSTNPQAQFPTTVNLRGTYAKLAGSHSVKTGYEWLGLNILVDDTNPLYGIDAFGGAYSRPAAGVPAGVNNSWYHLADFFAGARSSYQLATQVEAKVRQRGNFFFVQDDWKATRKLTLNMGLRYDLMTPVFDADNKLSNFDPTTNQIVLATDDDRSLQRQPKNTFAPRLGAAYQLDGKTVIRGGYGLGWNFWNRMASAELMNTNAPFVTRFSTTNSPANLGNLCVGNAFTNCFRTREQGYPVTPPSNVILHIDRETPWGYVQNWHFTVQRTLFQNTLLDVAYVGNKGSRLPILGDLNQARPITADELSRGLTTLGTLLARRPFQGFNNITAVQPTGFSNYHAMQLKFEHRGRDLTLLSSFTWAKAIDNVGQVLDTPNGGSPNPQDIRNPQNDKGASSFDQRFNSTTSFVYQMPFGTGRKFGKSMPGALDAVLGGWEASAIVSLLSGQPLNLRYPDAAGILSDGQPDFLGNVALRPNYVGGDILSNTGTDRHLGYFNRTVLAVPAVTSPFGTLGRNVVYGFPLRQTNLVLAKSFRLPTINEGARLTFRSEFYNLFNQTNFAAPDVNFASATFGRVSSTFDPRFVQLALKLSF
ncbi:MAG: carboxypeptidase regulatory-like domain-containing protein [Bryobacteraceae bacterium]